jgi:hypothetical protein
MAFRRPHSSASVNMLMGFQYKAQGAEKMSEIYFVNLTSEHWKGTKYLAPIF